MALTSLQQRILTASLLAPLAVYAVLALPTPYLALTLGLLLLIAAWEWSRLVGLTTGPQRLAYVLLLALVLFLLWSLPVAGTRLLLLGVGLGWWLMAAWLFRISDIRPALGRDLGLMLAGLPLLAAPWLAMTHLHGASPEGPSLVLFLLVLIWSADSAAYFTGRRWGKTRLAPVLSPGKTWAGVYGAGLSAILLGLVLALGLELGPLAWPGAVLLCLATAFISIVGDLFESLLKRRRGLKDSGQLLPGHGGLLDRIDSLIAAAPVFALGLLMLGVLP